MKPNRARSNPTGHPAVAANPESSWNGVYKWGGIAALTIVALMPVQIVVLTVWPPPAAVTDWFALFQDNWLLGLLSMDLIYVFETMILGLVYLALYAALRQTSPSAMLIALLLGLIGIASYFASSTAFEMLALSGQYAAAATETERSVLLAAGQSMLATYKGTAFDVYYVMNAATLLITSIVMVRSDLFSKPTAYVGLAAGVLMLIPSTAGTVGMVFALASLAPWAVFSVLIARRFFEMARDPRGGTLRV